MNENQLAKNIKYYRKKKGLSQEKLSEYMNVSRQAVTKWEASSSKPSSENLIKLAQIFAVDVDTLLGYDKQEKTSHSIEPSIGKISWIFIGISVFCILVYIIYSLLVNRMSIGVLSCLFILCVPIQLFLHVYFSYAIKNNSYSYIAGFDDKIEYHMSGVKKLLIQIDLHMGVLSTVYIFLFCVLNVMDLKIRWINGALMVLYFLNFIAEIEMNNYKMIDQIYCHENDKKRAKYSILVTVLYSLILCVGIVITGIIFEIKGIENNTLPALKIGGLLSLGIISATIGLFLESNHIKKWNPTHTNYHINKASLISLLICLLIYGFMWIV